MSFVSPDRWMWAAIAIPIILLYVLRSRLRRQPVSTLLFWDELFDQKRQRSWWQRLRHLLSLLLQLVFLLLVVLALLDPLWPGRQQATRQIVLIVDNSASMSAKTKPSTDESISTTRFTGAIRAAQDIVRELRDGDEIALITAGSTVRVVVGMTDFGPVVRDAIDLIEPTDGPTRVTQAVKAARRLTGSSDRREIVVISDGGFDDVDDVSTAKDVRWISIGTPQDNVAITRMSVRRSLVDPIGYAMLLEVSHFGQSDTSCRLSIELNDDLVDVIPLRLTVGQVWKKAIIGASADGGTLRAELDVDDALDVDNVAMAVLPRRGKIPVTLVTPEPNLYLESVFSAIPLVDLNVATEIPEKSPEGGFIVLHRSDTGKDKLPSGRVLVIDPRSDSPLWQLGPAIEQAIVVTQDKTSPLMPHVNLQNVLLPGARGLDMVENATSLLTEAGGQTLMASMVAGDDRVVVLSAKLDDGDLPLRIAFPVMMTNAVNWFLSRSGEIEPALQTGVPSKVFVGANVQGDRTWTDPSGVTHDATTDDESILIGPVDRVGMMTVQRSEPPRQKDEATEPVSEIKNLAVNLCDASESDLRNRGTATDARPPVPRSGLRSIWFYLICIALALIVGEWFLYQRRIVG